MIIFIGPPGAGKSLQASLIEERLGAKWLSVGRVLRETLTGEKEDLLEKGELLDDETVTGAISTVIHSVPLNRKVLLDGFPRKDTQLEWLFTPDNPRPLLGVVVIEVSDETIVERLSKRGREDDDAETMRHRISLYKDEIGPILSHFKNLHIPVLEVDGEGTIEEVYARLHFAIETLKKGNKHADQG